MIEQNVTEIAKKLSLIDMNLTSMT
uniref:Transcriptional regulator n=1 Tax=Steinernema glaseri TaxID=37863 RepID=A0A1I7ZBL9_9BILA